MSSTAFHLLMQFLQVTSFSLPPPLPTSLPVCFSLGVSHSSTLQYHRTIHHIRRCVHMCICMYVLIYSVEFMCILCVRYIHTCIHSSLIFIAVYGSAPLTVDMKQDLKKTLSPSFTKPRPPQLAPEDLARNKVCVCFIHLHILSPSLSLSLLLPEDVCVCVCVIFFSPSLSLGSCDGHQAVVGSVAP